MADIPAIKVANDAAVTNKSSVDSLSPADEGGRLNAITDELRPYEVYSFAIFKGGSDTFPVVRVYENTIGPIVWERSGVGDYALELAGAFPANRTMLIPSTGYYKDQSSPLLDFHARFTIDESDEDYVYLAGYVDELYSDEIFGKQQSFEIRVYPAVLETIEFV